METIKRIDDLDKISNTTKEIILIFKNLLIDDVIKLASVLENNTIITTIDIGHNLVRNEGAKAIASALEKNKSITSISLAMNQISDEGANAIALALEKNKSIISICLNYPLLVA